MRQVIVLAFLVPVVAFMPAVTGLDAAMAQTTYTFQPSDGVWRDMDNWDPQGIPTYGDTAVIPSGKTCRVQTSNEAVKILDVQGTLGLVGYALGLGDVSSPTTSTIDGTLYLESNGDLEVMDLVTIDGEGVITASKADDEDRAGIISCHCTPAEFGCTARGKGIVISQDVILEGSITITAGLTLDGIARVDYSGDVMNLGAFGAGDAHCTTLVIRWVDRSQGSDGKFVVSDGKLRVKYMKMDTDNAPDWELTGGEIEIVNMDPFSPCQCTGTNIKITVSGGVLDIDDDFSTNRGITWSGGRIEVQEGLSIPFQWIAP